MKIKLNIFKLRNSLSKKMCLDSCLLKEGLNGVNR